MTTSRSPLPDEDEFWEGLADKVRADAAGPLSRYAASEADQSPTWIAVVSRQAPWLLAASVIAMVALLSALPESAASTALTTRLLERSLMPTEPAAGLMAGSKVPSVAELLVEFPPPTDGNRDS